MASRKSGKKLENAIERVLKEKLDHYLSDITFRIGQAYELIDRVNGSARGTVYAEDLNLPGRAFITGYTITDNSPVAGSIAWADLHVVYNGQDYAITNGNTANAYAWWSPTTTPTVLQTSNTKPTLAQGEVLLFTNVGGKAKVMLSDTHASLPSVVADGTVDSGAIIAGAVGSTQLGDNAVTSAKIGANAVTAGKINTGAINSSTLFTTGVVGSTAIADTAISSTKLADDAVTSAKVADGAINSTTMLSGKIITGTNMVDGTVGTTQLGSNAVTSTKLADGAVSTTAKLANGIVNNDKLAGGAVTATKMNIARHLLY